MNKLKPKNVNLVIGIILILGIMISFFGLLKENTSLIIVGMVIMCGAIIFRLIFYRCPHCGKYLDRSTGQYCPYCGEEVNK